MTNLSNEAPFPLPLIVQPYRGDEYWARIRHAGGITICSKIETPYAQFVVSATNSYQQREAALRAALEYYEGRAIIPGGHRAMSKLIKEALGEEIAND